MSTDAERMRRYRRHKAGDHSMCDPQRSCRLVDALPTPAVRERGPRGQRLWDDEGGDKLTGARRELLEEACRIADRLDRLDGVLDGDPGVWARFQANTDGTEVVVTLDKAIAEARQQATTLKQLLGELRRGGTAAAPKAGGGVLDQLAARRSRRRADAAG